MSLQNSNIAGGLVRAINNIENPKKTEVNDAFGNSFSYAPLEEVIRVVKEALSKEGMTVIQIPRTTYETLPNGFQNGVIGVTTKLLHESGEVLEFPEILANANGATPQAIASAMTYARRYSLNSIFGVAGEEDDDGNTSSLNGANTGHANSVPVNPNKGQQDKKNKKENDSKKVELISDEQYQELYQLADELAKLKNTSTDGIINAFGDVSVDMFEPSKAKLTGWIEKAKAESPEPVEESNKEESKKGTAEKNAQTGSSVFTVVSKELKKTTEGTEYYEVFVKGAKLPMLSKVDVAKNLNEGDKFVGHYSKKGTKVTLQKIEDVQSSLV